MIVTEYLIVDGYNIINAWPELDRVKEESFEHARIKLIDILVDYHGSTKKDVIIVFDAHQVKGGIERREKYPGVEVIYTKEGESADILIERLAWKLCSKGRVYVATSDWIEQNVIMQRGALRLSARELLNDVKYCVAKNREVIYKMDESIGALKQKLPDDVQSVLEKWRRGKL